MAVKKNGDLFANGSTLFVVAKETKHPDGSTSIMMGGPIADCQNPETAEELAAMANAFRPLCRALAFNLAVLSIHDFGSVTPAQREWAMRTLQPIGREEATQDLDAVIALAQKVRPC